MSKSIDTELLAAAQQARERAYAPYSNHAVGAAIRTPEGTIHVGVNVENAAYPQGVCAEASAISAMVLAGERRIAAIAVVGPGPGPCVPCGGCRQKIWEFGAADTVVIVAGGGTVDVLALGALLPHAFGPDALA